MTAGAARDAGLKAAEVAAWCLHVWVLAQLLPSSDLGRVLHALVFSTCVAAILTAGWKKWLAADAADDQSDRSAAWSAAVAGLAVRGLIALPAITLILWQVGGKVLFPYPEMPVMIAVIAGLLSLLRLCGFALRTGEESVRAGILTGALPVLLSLSAVLVAAEFRPVQFDLVLSLHALALAAGLVLASRRLPQLRWTGDLPKARVFADSMAQSGTILYRNIDIVVIGLVLSPVEAAIYLIVRAVALLLDLVFRALSGALAEPIALSYRTGNRLLFVAQAARANLGFLLIGGAGALLLFVATGPVLQVFGIAASEGRQPLVYLIVAQAAPAVFGATHLIMAVTNLDGVRAWIVWAAMPLALIATFAAARDGIASLAATYAALQVGIAAVSAAIVALHCGIWPGLTAMFHSRLRLR